MKNNSIKRYFQLFALLMVVWFSSVGCITKQIWTDQTILPSYHRTGERDNILSFYTDQKEKLVCIGERYHYIFDKDTQDLIALLQNKDHPKIEKKNLQISLTSEYNDSKEIEAKIYLNFTKDSLTAQQIAWLQREKFEPRRVIIPPIYHNERNITRVIYQPQHAQERPQESYQKEFKIAGTRYLASNEINQELIKLEEPIEVYLHPRKPLHRHTLTKIALTPLTLTADVIGGAVLLVGAVIMSPVWLYQAVTKD